MFGFTSTQIAVLFFWMLLLAGLIIQSIRVTVRDAKNSRMMFRELAKLYTNLANGVTHHRLAFLEKSQFCEKCSNSWLPNIGLANQMWICYILEKSKI